MIISLFALANKRGNSKYCIAGTLPLCDTFMESWLVKIFQASSIKFSLGLTVCGILCFSLYSSHNSCLRGKSQGGGKYLLQPKRLHCLSLQNKTLKVFEHVVKRSMCVRSRKSLPGYPSSSLQAGSCE